MHPRAGLQRTEQSVDRLRPAYNQLSAGLSLYRKGFLAIIIETVRAIERRPSFQELQALNSFRASAALHQQQSTQPYLSGLHLVLKTRLSDREQIA